MSIIAPANTGGSTARSLILLAYQMLGYYGANEELRSADVSLGMSQLNMMLDSWSNEALMTYAILEQSFPLVIGKSSYKIGLSNGADVPLQRPLRILEGPVSAYLQDGNQNNYRVDTVSRESWNQIANRGPQTTSNIPDTLFYDPQFPLGIINIWPTPTIAYTLFFDSYQMFTDMTSVDQRFSLPPGYELAIESNLAVLLSPFVMSKPAPQTVVDIARKSKANVKRSNKRDNVAQFDKEITKSGQPNFNIYSGRYQ